MKTKKICILCCLFSLFVAAAATVFSACGKNVNYDALPQEELYAYNFDEPFSAAPDVYMKMDGKFNEGLWQNKQWLTSCSQNTSMRATTAFTSEGLYIGVEAFDTNITWIGRNSFKETGNEKTNSFFKIQVIKAGQSPTNDKTKDLMFYMDCFSVCSHRERQIAAGAYLDGEVNSGATVSLSGEIFVPWTEMGYTDEEVNEYGYPESLQMDVKYLRVFEGTSGNNFTVKSSPLQLYTFTSYPYYNENGLTGAYDCEEFGSAINGSPATDKWEIEKDEEGKAVKLTTTVDRAQTIFFRRDSQGNAKSASSDFILETRVRVLPLSENSVPVCGLWIGSYLVTGVRGDQLYNNKLMLQNSKSISDAQWMGEPQDFTIKTVAENDYRKDYVDLRIVKYGTELYYFYNDLFFKTETRSNFSGAKSVGLFANGKAEFTNFRFVDYSDDTAALKEYLSDYVYFVKTQKAGAKGAVNSDVLAVKKGDSLTLTVQPALECYLSQFTVNGESKIEDVEKRLDVSTGTYVFVPESDVEISYKFEYINEAQAVKTVIGLFGKDGTALGSAKFRLTSDSALFYCSGTANDKGFVTLSLLKEGALLGENSFGGIYRISFESNGYNPAVGQFEISSDAAKENRFVFYASKVNYGAVKVNGYITSVQGTPSYNIETGGYYMPSGNVKQYFIDSATNEESGYDYAVEATIKVSPVKEGGKLDDSHNGVSGIAIASGATGQIILKQTGYSWEKNRLCLQVGDYEVSVSGFDTDINGNGGIIKIKLVRTADAIYVFDADGNVGFYMDEAGLHLVGTHRIKTTQQSNLQPINNLIARFFRNGKENVVGMINYDNVKAEYDVQTKKGADEAAKFVKVFAFEKENQTYTATVEGLESNGKYIIGSVVTVAVTCSGNQYAKELTVQGASGTEMIAGVIEDGRTIFEYTIKEDVTATITRYIGIQIMEGKVSGATGAAKLALYDTDGTFIEEYTDAVNDEGEYALRILEGDYNIIVSQGTRLAFIDAGTINGALAEAFVFVGGTINGVSYAAAEMDYYAVKAAAQGKVVPYATGKQITLSNSVTDGEYAYRVAVDTRTEGAKNTNGAVAGISNGNSFIRLLRYGPRILELEVWNGNTRIYDAKFNDMANGTSYVTAGAVADLGFISDRSGSNYAYGFEKRSDAIYISVGLATDNMFEIFKVTANGIEAADGRTSYVAGNGNKTISVGNAQKAAINATLQNSVADEDILKSVLSGFFGAENGLFVISAIANTPFEISKMPYIEDPIVFNISGRVEGATSAAKLSLHDATSGALVKEYEKVFDDDGNYIVSVETESEYNIVVTENGKAAFLDAGVTDGTLVPAYSMTGTTYAEKKASASGSWTYNAGAGQYATQKLTNFSPDGDYEIEMTLSGANARGTLGNAGIDILSGGQKGYVRLIFGTDCNNGNGAFLLVSDGTTESRTGIILQKDGADYSVGRFNSASMYVSVKIVRKNGVITISAKSGESKEYTAVLQIDGNGISACDNGYTYLNHSKKALDLSTFLSDKASALAAYTTGVNTFRFFHYSTNGYTYNCSVTVTP
ncbi:MAG: hypothetical protein SPH68_01170 [Candidatus Borkfalkiaceae bacterium]|nr:hypothetical protein [Clostridia bacterium]MDY6222755.1 hypothetical protein [Christensenellaceae bacterium]